MANKITVETVVRAPIGDVWRAWTAPAEIQKWLHASDDWECSAATNDLRVGGRFSSRMGAKDGSTSFDFAGTYTAVEENKLIAYTMDDGRTVTVSFEPADGGARVVETFEMENENSEELQRSGWQAILDNFKSHVEGRNRAGGSS